MQGNPTVIELLNRYLTLELTAVNIYFGHSRMCESWGFHKLAAKLREIAMAEMHDVEEIIDRILFFEGVPNLQRLETVTLGENAKETLEVGIRVEAEALEFLTGAVKTCVEEGDEATREFLAKAIPAEEEHLDWLEAQLELIESVGEDNYLAQQIHE